MSEELREPEHPLLKYFHANWFQCRTMWSAYGRSDVPHLENTTNNRLEAVWGHLEDVLKPTVTMDEGADSELNQLAKEASQHAYQLVEEQYRVANDRNTHYTVRELHQHVHELTSSIDSTRVYHVDTKVYRCSCTRTKLLPCRHVIYWWLISNKTPMKQIHSRWCLTYPLNIPIDDDEMAAGETACRSFRVKDYSLNAPRHKVLNGTNKFRTAYDVGCRIAAIMSRNGTSVYQKMLEALRSFGDAVRMEMCPNLLKHRVYRAPVMVEL
ncbi:hypothetical protein PC121_g15689 [Phytophthora cactorum]|nr:hypothetical protein PC121_g15689 [Phytophthora cactorum]